MAERKKLTTRKPASTTEAKEAPKHVERALRDVTEEVKPKRVPYDTHPDTHRKLSSMRVMSRDNVPVKSFLDEAVEDLFEKYRRGEGRFDVKDIDRILGE
ncbi:hypothetical protein HAPgp32 [Halomonas phage phiHAP-1]|jgi:hypothetical protein|uniref:Uncharacterized protein n=1 Tax=Halomonas phage phiHAP-1 (isolate -/Gulf of Mexico/-/2001) TaxID=1283337 RepID=B0ZSI0_BPHA1|nr:hypothetical protein HAPgp32 [Halomonas phage phiHAP-1]ABY90400.1 hypothetical protein HAPgp32 [Halomonas phage phiHAP-1]|tara:strand:- start:37439 stop:37738 length:300 start_codon:yes stop_codon:yes gene_type:complete